LIYDRLFEPDVWIASPRGWTPYEGVTVTGWPVGTVFRGQLVVREGSLVAAAVRPPATFLD
jgi:dihydroorotase